MLTALEAQSNGMHRQPATRLSDSHPVPGPTRALIDAIVRAVRTGDDPGIRVLLTQLAPLADTTTLLLLRYRLRLSKGLNEASVSHPTLRAQLGNCSWCQRQWRLSHLNADSSGHTAPQFGRKLVTAAWRRRSRQQPSSWSACDAAIILALHGRTMEPLAPPINCPRPPTIPRASRSN